MDNEPVPEPAPDSTPPAPQRNGWRTFGIIVITVAVTLGAGYWAASNYLFPSGFKPVVLSEQNRRQLDRKLERLGGAAQAGKWKTPQPEAYTETDASREVEFSEKELNALLARNTDLAHRLAIDLSENLASAVLLVDMPPDFPVLGGKTIKVTGGMELRLVDGKPSAVLKGISVWGVPLPNAWLGNMKNVDLFRQSGGEGGFWQTLGDGIESIRVEEGKMRIRLRE